MLPEETYTIEQFIKSDVDNNISYEVLCFLNKISDDNDKIITYNVLNDYLSEIMDLTVTVEFSDTEYLKYRFKPKLLANNVYGDSELFYIILYLNNIYNVKDFDFRKVKLLKKDTLEFVLSSIYNTEQQYIDTYNDK